MKLQNTNSRHDLRRSGRGSVLIIVLWIAIGLIGITLYFANSMTLELRASDNRVNGLAADQAIEGAARYVGYALANYATNGATGQSGYQIPVGQSSSLWVLMWLPKSTSTGSPQVLAVSAQPVYP